jgi:iron complex transport system ATP-binding protein
MQVQELAKRDYHTLSGGEAQKIQMCRVLAQIGEIGSEENKLLLLDEPVSHLDVKYQHQLLQEAKILCDKKVAVLAVLHDINLSLKYADRILFMKDGHLIRSLSRYENIDAVLVKEVFDAEANVFDLPDGNGKFVVF